MLIRNRLPLGPYSRPVHDVLGGGAPGVGRGGKNYTGTSFTRKRAPPHDYHRAIGISYRRASEGRCFDERGYPVHVR